MENGGPKFLNSEQLFDAIVHEIQKRFIARGLEEAKLPNATTRFSKKKLGIRCKGRLQLTNGKFYGLGTIHRVGDASLTFSHAALQKFQNIELIFTTNLALTQPQINYDFRVFCLNMEKKGTVTGIISEVTFSLVLSVNLLTRRIHVVLFQFRDIGMIKTDVTGLGVFNYFGNKIAQSVANQMKEEMKDQLEMKLERILKAALDDTKCPIPYSIFRGEIGKLFEAIGTAASTFI